jgi:hypothetical protein
MNKFQRLHLRCRHEGEVSVFLNCLPSVVLGMFVESETLGMILDRLGAFGPPGASRPNLWIILTSPKPRYRS